MTDGLTIELVDRHELWFGPDDPVRAASAIAAFQGGWLIAQDDAVHAAWWRRGRQWVQRLALLPPVDGHEVFSEAAGTKHLKPDLESGCEVRLDGRTAVLLLGSGSLPARCWAVLVTGPDEVHARALPALFGRVRELLSIERGALNLEGACVVGDRLRWFQRGQARTGTPSCSIDVDLDALLAAIHDDTPLDGIPMGDVRTYTLDRIDGFPLAITDAVTLRDRRIVVSATAEDAPDPVADGPILGSAMALLDDDDATVIALPDDLARCKLEGLALIDETGEAARLLAVVDQDDPTVASLAFTLRIT